MVGVIAVGLDEDTLALALNDFLAVSMSNTPQNTHQNIPLLRFGFDPYHVIRNSHAATST